jgi:cardiolipin synthase (CMP-forming)
MIGQLLATPNLLTLLRLIFIPLTVIAVLENHYIWALSLFIVAGISDGLDGLLARLLEQKTVLGQYLDPVADKLLLSTMFLVLSTAHKIPWAVTVLVFARDIIIVIICALLYATTSIRSFPPSIWGKANTLAQIVTIPLVLLREISSNPWIVWSRYVAIRLTVALTIFSVVHYAIRVAFELRNGGAKSAQVSK